MKSLKTRHGFTLIELLVVITIIGILATGGVTVYTSQIQKARDSTRISSMESLRGGIEQYYQDNSMYPPASPSFSGVTLYIPKFPVDPKSGQASSRSFFDYTYTVNQDANSIIGQEFEVSTAFEQAGNITGKAANNKDNGNNANRYESGIDVRNNNSGSGATAVTTGIYTSCQRATVGTVGGTTTNPTSNECIYIR